MVRLLYLLTYAAEIRSSVRYSGLVKSCVEYLQGKQTELQQQAIRIIANLAVDGVSRLELLDANAVPEINKLMNSLTSSQKAVFQATATIALQNLEIPG